MDKAYDPHAIEQQLYKQWEDNNYFTPVKNNDSDPYCILIPPPNVTGTLHMGHAFQHTLMDTLTRYHRMRGNETLWQTGTDHAGIATQMVVERQLNAEGKTRHDLGRDAFVDKVWEWKKYSGGEITRQMRRLGNSTDWSREVFTMDDNLSRAVREVFIRLHDEGLIYRGKRLVNWDPALLTAVSDLEVVSAEEDGHLWHLRYPLTDGSGHLTVATTRPETMLGDTAVAVHPDDKRYKKLVGKTITLPLTDREIPVIADDYVDQEFGTGCVKITPAHDFNDYDIGQRHDLPVINVLNPDASINDDMPTPYRGLERFAARKKIVADLDTAGALEKTEKHKLMVPRGDRSGAVLEPFLTDQWYVKTAPLAEPAIKAVENGDIRFVPENWSKTYYNWMHNIQDWCISRQLWWGHRIPAWYDEQGNVYVGENEADVRKKYKLDKSLTLKQDEDVLDTWFSSALWPFATLGWPDETPELEKFLPSNVLVTGFDIIFFWVARMIMMTLKFTGKTPFREVYITGLIRDEHGQKMSKSKGNVLDPIDLIDGIERDALIEKRTSGMMQPQQAEKIRKRTAKEFPGGIRAHGTDALRFTLAALASPTRDINFDLGRLEGYRNFCNKLWNAARYVLLNTEGQDNGLESSVSGELEFSLADRWIRSRLARTIDETQRHFRNYRFDLAARALYEFTWNDYCDWYLELAKATLHDDTANPAQLRGTRHTLCAVLETLLRLLHPIMPFITEEIWQRIAPLAGRKKGDTIMRQPYPASDSFRMDSDVETQMHWVMDFIAGIRRIRGEMDIAPGKPLPILIENADDQDRKKLKQHKGFLDNLARLESITLLEKNAAAPESAVALLGNMRILVPMAGLIDKEAELARLGKLIGKAEKNLQQVQGKLHNEKFIANAPEKIVRKEQARVESLQTELCLLDKQKTRIKAL